MSLAAQPRARQLTASWLSALRAEGYPLGVDDYQRVQELLLRLPNATPDAQLGASLTALFATNPAAQRRLGELFEQARAEVDAMNAPAEPAAPEAEDEDIRRDRRGMLLTAVPLVLLIVSGLAIAWWNRGATYVLPDRELALDAGGEVALTRLDSLDELGRVDTVLLPAYGGPQAPKNGTLTHRADSVYYSAGTEAGLDSAVLELRGQGGRKATVRYRITIRPRAIVMIDTIQTETGATEVLPVLSYAPIDPLPYPRGLADLVPLVPQDEATRAWLRRWWPLFWALFLVLLAGLAYYLLRYLHHRRIRLVARRDRADGPPHFWRIELPELRREIDFGEQYPLLLRQLRRRRRDAFELLDVRASVRATIDKGGLPVFRYRSATRPAEYLLLIDRGGADNHRAELFEQLYQRLLADEVLIERYFYDGDPRRLYQHDRAQTVTLGFLEQRFPQARLLLVGTGDRLLSPSSGKLSNWVRGQLGSWSERSLLSARPLADWGRRERRLASFFTLLPATLQGARLLVERLNAESERDTALDPRTLVDDAVPSAVRLEGNLIDSLKGAFTIPALKWIAACALYPSLHWDLTLFWGQRVGAATGTALLTARQLLQLNRLPWFTRGAIPDPARRELVEWLEDDDPALLIQLRQALHRQLERLEPPPAGSRARQDFEFVRLQNEWLLAAPGSPRRAELGEELAQRIEEGLEPDITTIHYLEQPGPFDVVLPDRLKKRLYPEGFSGLPLRPAVRQLAWVVPAFLLLAAAAWWLRPDVAATECNAPILEVLDVLDHPRDTVYQVQLCDRADSLVYQEYLRRVEIGFLDTLSDTALSNAAFNTIAYNRFLQERLAPESYQMIQSEDAQMSPGEVRDMGADSRENRLDTYEQILELTDVWENYLALSNPLASINSLVAAPPQDSLERTLRANLATALFNQGLEVRDSSRTTDPVSCAFYAAARGLDSSQVRYRRFVEQCQLDQTRNAATRAFEQQRAELLKLEQSLRIQPGAQNSEAVLDWFEAVDQWIAQQLELLAQERPTDSATYNALLQRGQGLLAELTAAVPQEEYIICDNAYRQEADAQKRVAELSQYRSLNTNQINYLYIPDYECYDGRALYQVYIGPFDAKADAYAELCNYSNNVNADAYLLNLCKAGPRDEEVRCGEEPSSVGAEPPSTAEGTVPAEATPQQPIGKSTVPRPSMVAVPGGTFEMGDVLGDNQQNDEEPVHTVTLSAFELGRYEVTFEEYDLFCDSTNRDKPEDEGWGRGRRPVINVSWEDAVEYCNWLSTQHGYQPAYQSTRGGWEWDRNANGYRLPTEAEWEYAARQGGQRVRFGNGKDIADPAEMNFYGLEDLKEEYSVVGVYRAKTVEAGSLNSPNALDLHDMSGNVWEWCWDWYSDYSSAASTNPSGPASGSSRVLRGGGWGINPRYCRAAYRFSYAPSNRYVSVGFRLSRSF